MPKIRKPKTIKNKDQSEKELIFISESQDGENTNNKINSSSQILNKNAKKDYKAIRIPFNEYEYNELKTGAELSGRSKLNFIRNAILNQTNIERKRQEKNK